MTLIVALFHYVFWTACILYVEPWMTVKQE